MRDEWNVKNLIEPTLSINSQKFLLFLIKLAYLAFNKDSAMSNFIETEVIPSLSISKDLQKKLINSATEYFELSQKLYDCIYYMTADGKFLGYDTKKELPFLKLFFIDHNKLASISITEKTSFLKILIYLMKEDNKIDESEKNVLTLIDQFLGTASSMYIDSEDDISLKEMSNITTLWFKHVLLFFYLHSIKTPLKKYEYKRIDIVLHGMQITKDNFQKNMIVLMDRYNSIWRDIFTMVTSKDIGEVISKDSNDISFKSFTTLFNRLAAIKKGKKVNEVTNGSIDNKDEYDITGWNSERIPKSINEELQTAETVINPLIDNKKTTQYNQDGYDQDGYNKDGYDETGWNSKRIHKKTGTKLDQYGYDQDGYDIKGWNIEGIHKKTGTKFDEEDYDEDGYNEFGWNREGINRKTGTKFDEDGCDRYSFHITS
ncbi:MAG: hypothetical protein HQK77_12900 [Desulfobacterales bacterium]|nr:hypothetical protein [Desulfobacterales bacterium]